MLSEKFNLKVYRPDELIAQALESAAEEDEPLEEL